MENKPEYTRPPFAEALKAWKTMLAERGLPAELLWIFDERLGSHDGKSVCLLLCDQWFRTKTESEGYTRRREWHMAFRPGTAQELEEVKDKQRWEARLLRNRPLHDLDFCMTLRAVHETLAHGRVLTAYERYALKLLHVWRHWLGDPR
jgi:hypothetical protein